MFGEEVKGSGIEKFDGIDFGYWRMQIEDYLYGKKLHLPLLGTKPESMLAADWTLLDKQVFGRDSVDPVKISCTQCDQGKDHSRVDGNIFWNV